VPAQNIPGQIYNSESGFVTPLIIATNNTSIAGLADYGTRLKAVFNSVPAGVRIFVSTTNVINLTGVAGTAVTSSSASFAQLVLSETAIDGNGSAPTVPAQGYTTVSTTTQVYPWAEISVVANSATAVWEVINTNPATPENFDFGVFVTTTSNPASGTPAPGTATVNMSYAPTGPVAFSTSAGAAASGSLTIPRFADASGPTSIFTISLCTTSLLFPFVTNQAGFDTGVAIMNTTSDPFGTKPQAGTCTMTFYGQNAPPPVTTASIPSGNNTAPSTYAFLASSIAPNFQGYMIALCQFQLAHGYAFITKLGAVDLAHGYLALILNKGTGARTDNPEMLEN
jgi:hypothetical protein